MAFDVMGFPYALRQRVLKPSDLRSFLFGDRGGKSTVINLEIVPANEIIRYIRWDFDQHLSLW